MSWWFPWSRIESIKGMKLDYLQPKDMMTNDSYKHSISNIEERAYRRNKLDYLYYDQLYQLIHTN
jgi:hypothetical protein